MGTSKCRVMKAFTKKKGIKTNGSIKSLERKTWRGNRGKIIYVFSIRVQKEKNSK